MHHLHHLGRPVLAAAFLTLLAGCQTWRPTGIDPRSLIAEGRPESVRITLSNGSVVTIPEPAIVGDSIVGFTFSGTVRTATSDVTTLEVPRFSLPRTSGLVIAHVSVVIGFLALVVHFQPHYRGL